MFPPKCLIGVTIYLACGAALLGPANALPRAQSMLENVFKSGMHKIESTFSSESGVTKETEGSEGSSPSSTGPAVDDNMTPKKSVHYLIFQDVVEETTSPSWEEQSMSNQLMWYVFSGILVMITIVSIMISGIVLGRWMGRRHSRRYGEDGGDDDEDIDIAALKQQNCYKLLEEFDMENMDRAFECDDGSYVTGQE